MAPSHLRLCQEPPKCAVLASLELGLPPLTLGVIKVLVGVAVQAVAQQLHHLLVFAEGAGESRSCCSARNCGTTASIVMSGGAIGMAVALATQTSS